jgi:hypothetical protein
MNRIDAVPKLLISRQGLFPLQLHLADGSTLDVNWILVSVMDSVVARSNLIVRFFNFNLTSLYVSVTFVVFD